MKKVLMLVVILMLLPNVAEAQPIERVPGCATYQEGWVYTPSNGWMPRYLDWCGSDSIGWYDPTQWCMVSGYCFKDYGITDE